MSGVFKFVSGSLRKIHEGFQGVPSEFLWRYRGLKGCQERTSGSQGAAGPFMKFKRSCRGVQKILAVLPWS